jgi:ComEC/Rec2-related protein
MVVVALLPAGALVVGAVLGFAVPLPAACWWALLILGWCGSVIGLATALSRFAPAAFGSLFTAAACTLGFTGAGAVLAQRATLDALEPAIVAQSAPFRVDVVGLVASPLPIEGDLVGDAVATEFGAAFTIDIRRIRIPPGARAPPPAPESGAAAPHPSGPGARGPNYAAPDAGGVNAVVPHAGEPGSGGPGSGDPGSAGPGAGGPDVDGADADGAAANGADADGTAAAAWRRSAGRVRVTVGGTRAREWVDSWRAGRRIRAPVLLNAPLPYRNFGVVDQEQRLALAGIRLFGSIKSAGLVEVVGSGRWWQEACGAIRAFVRRTVAAWVGRWDARSAGIVTAILIGDRAGLDPQTESRLQRAGTYHVIAISGGNIAILVTVVSALLRVAGIAPRPRAWLAIGIVIVYAAIVGSGASVARATLGAVLYLVAHAIDHRSAAINILGVAIAAILVLAPLEVIDPAFWLTCVATLAILVCAERLQTQLLAWCGAGPSPAAGPADGPAPAPAAGLAPARARWIQAPLALLAATIAAESWLLPIAAYAFSQVTFAGLLLNFAAIPLMAIAQIGGFVVVVATACWLTPIALAAGYVTHLAAYGLVESARLVELCPQVALRLAPPPLWVVILAECSAIACWLPRHCTLRRRVCAIAAWSGTLAIIIAAPPAISRPATLQSLHAATARPPCPPPALPQAPPQATAPAEPLPALPTAPQQATAPAGPQALTAFPQALPTAPPQALPTASPQLPPEALPTASPQPPQASPQEARSGQPSAQWLRLTSLDVAQGDATLVRWPDGGTLMVDAGGSVTGAYDVGARVVSPALWALGLRRLQTLALTHGDRDHIGGASALLRDFAPREVWEGVPVAGHVLLAALRQQADAQGARWRGVHTGDRPVPQVRVWNPPVPDWQRDRVRNDDSIVLEITYGAISIVLPGDIGADVERRLATEVPPAPLRILKAAHHGSGHSSTAAFLRALAPRIAIISAGRSNRFGHPAPATLDRYRAIDTTIFRTDQEGAIQIDTNGRDVFIATCSGRTLHLTAPPPQPHPP